MIEFIGLTTWWHSGSPHSKKATGSIPSLRLFCLEFASSNCVCVCSPGVVVHLRWIRNSKLSVGIGLTLWAVQCIGHLYWLSPAFTRHVTAVRGCSRPLWHWAQLLKMNGWIKFCYHKLLSLTFRQIKYIMNKQHLIPKEMSAKASNPLSIAPSPLSLGRKSYQGCRDRHVLVKALTFILNQSGIRSVVKPHHDRHPACSACGTIPNT